MNIAKTTLAWWSFFMLRNSCLILTYFIFASVSFAKVILNSIDNEQIAHLYAVCLSLKKYSSVEYITLKKGDSLIERHDIKQLIPLLHQRFVEDKELGNLVENFKNQNIFSNFNEKQLRFKEIRNPEYFEFSKSDGKKIIKFYCNIIKFNKLKYGPFELPYSSHLVINPNLEFY